jgi:hypothetical protein
MKRFLFAALALGLAACSKSSPTAASTGSVTPVQLPDNHPAVTPLPDPEMNGGHAGRAPRRISVAQLDQSIITTTGRAWADLPDLASSLGQADYALVVSDSTEANLVFAKFLDDGARKVCLAVSTDDLTKAPADRVLTSALSFTGTPDFTALSDDEIHTNLQSLALRFWGSQLTDAELAQWTGSYKTFAARAKAINKPAQAWAPVCVAMMTDQRFITY